MKIIVAFVLALCVSLAYADTTEYIWVANRGTDGGSIDVIDPVTDEIEGSYEANFPQYITQIENWAIIDDRGNNSLIVVDLETEEADEIVLNESTELGLFHMWSDDHVAYVTCDLVGQIYAVDFSDYPDSVSIDAWDMPSDLILAGGIVHDVTAKGDFVYATIIKVNAVETALVILDKEDGSEVDRMMLDSADCHVATRDFSDVWLQCNAFIQIISYENDVITNEGYFNNTLGTSAHGDWVNKEFTFVTNLKDGGLNALMVFDTESFELLGTEDSPRVSPHNVVSTGDASKAYITHSIGDVTDYVSVYTIDGEGVPTYSEEIETSKPTPFGIFLITVEVEDDNDDDDNVVADSASTLNKWL